MHVYNNIPLEEFSVAPGEHFIGFLNSTFLSMWLVLFISIIFLYFILKYLWYLHEIPTYKARKTNIQANFVLYISLLGIFIHELWILAFIIAFVDWYYIESAFVRILKKANGTYDRDSEQKEFQDREEKNEALDVKLKTEKKQLALEKKDKSIVRKIFRKIRNR